MNGAETLVRTLLARGVGSCLVNPGTAEMRSIAAVDRVEGVQCVLVLFESKVTGVAGRGGTRAWRKSRPGISGIESAAEPFSGWAHTCPSATRVAACH